jgi:hypothetical protein
MYNTSGNHRSLSSRVERISEEEDADWSPGSGRYHRHGLLPFVLILHLERPARGNGVQPR